MNLMQMKKKLLVGLVVAACCGSVTAIDGPSFCGWERASGHFVRPLSHWNHEGREGAKIVFAAETDCPEAKLLVNGKQVGEVQKAANPGDANRFSWAVPYQPGLVQVIGMKDGRGVFDRGVRTAGAPASVRLMPDNKTGTCYRVQVAVVDRNGVENPLAATRVSMRVRGNARVEPQVVQLENGFGETVVTRLGEGEIELTGASDGLEPMSVFYGRKPVPEKTDMSFAIASYNVRAAMGCDPMPHRWFERAPRIVETIEHEGYDIVGIQEAERFWCKRLMALMPGWRYIYYGREANGEGESASIIWNDARFELVDQGNFWLSETPDVPGSRSWNSGCPRTCTWGRFKDRKTGKEFLLFNTHLDCSSLAARTNGMRVLLEHLVALRKQTGLPAFFMGDLNISYAYKRMRVDENHPLVMASKVLTAMWDKSETPHQGSFSSWLGINVPFDLEHPYADPDGRIDHLYVSDGVRVISSRTCDFFPQGLPTSDHRSISCDVELAGPHDPACTVIEDTRGQREWTMPFQLGLAGYTMRKKCIDEALEIMRSVDLHNLCVKHYQLKYTANDAEIAAFKAKCAAFGVTPYALGPLYTKSNEEVREYFEFARRFGVKVIVGVPCEDVPGKEQGTSERIASRKQLEYINGLVKEFDIRYAIHNHGPQVPRMFPDVAAGYELIKDLDQRIGFCIDVGWEYGCDCDPAKTIRKYGSRIYDVHLKNFAVNLPGAQKFGDKSFTTVPMPRGNIDYAEVFAALAEIGYSGVCSFEYERDFENNLEGLAESVGYARGICDAVGKVQGR